MSTYSDSSEFSNKDLASIWEKIKGISNGNNRGVAKVVNVPNFGVGADGTYLTVPANKYYMVLGLSFRFQSGVSAANRKCNTVIKSGATTIAKQLSSVTQTANQNFKYFLGLLANNNNQVGNDITQFFGNANGLLLDEGLSLMSQTDAIQVSDQYSEIYVFYFEVDKTI